MPPPLLLLLSALLLLLLLLGQPRTHGTLSPTLHT
eukprot:COSAG02_NODE_73213_length_175_cov_16.526316_1_plen_34_part_10